MSFNLFSPCSPCCTRYCANRCGACSGVQLYDGLIVDDRGTKTLTWGYNSTDGYGYSWRTDGDFYINGPTGYFDCDCSTGVYLSNPTYYHAIKCVDGYLVDYLVTDLIECSGEIGFNPFSFNCPKPSFFTASGIPICNSDQVSLSYGFSPYLNADPPVTTGIVRFGVERSPYDSLSCNCSYSESSCPACGGTMAVTGIMLEGFFFGSYQYFGPYITDTYGWTLSVGFNILGIINCSSPGNASQYDLDIGQKAAFSDTIATTYFIGSAKNINMNCDVDPPTLYFGDLADYTGGALPAPSAVLLTLYTEPVVRKSCCQPCSLPKQNLFLSTTDPSYSGTYDLIYGQGFWQTSGTTPYVRVGCGSELEITYQDYYYPAINNRCSLYLQNDGSLSCDPLHMHFIGSGNSCATVDIYIDE